MAKTDYGPEVKASMSQKKKDPGETPADRARDRQRGIKEGSPQDLKMDAQNAPSNTQQMMHPMGGPPDAHHVNAAASIAHAILGRRPM